MLKSLFCFSVASATSVALATGPYYLENSSDAKSSGWSNAYYWIDKSGARSGVYGASLDPAADYVVSTTTGLNTPSTESVDCYFGGKSLTLSERGRLFVLTRNSARIVFPAEGLILDSSEGSKFQAVDGAVYTLSGNIVVRGEDYVFSSEKNGQTFVLDGSLHGNGRLRFAKNAATVKLTGDLSAFSGTVALWVSQSRLEVSRNVTDGVLHFNGAGTLAVSDKVTVRSLTMPEGSTIEIGGWYRQNETTSLVEDYKIGCIAVTSSLSIGGQTRILVKECARVPNTGRIAVLTAPAECNLDPEDFSIDAAAFENPRLIVESENDKGCATLYLVYEPLIKPVEISDEVTIGSLELPSDAKLEFGGAGVKTDGVLTGWKSGCLTVTDSLSIGGRVNITVREDALVPVFSGENPARMSIPLIKMPASSVFDLASVSLSAEAFPSAELSMVSDEGNSTKTVVLSYEPTVVLTVSDSNSQNFDTQYVSSLAQKDHWSNGEAPREGFHYLIRARGVESPGADATGEHFIFLRTPGGSKKGSYCQAIFDGDSLTVGKGCCLTVMDTSMNFRENCKLRLLDGSAIRNGQGMSPHIVGMVEMPSGAVSVGTWGSWHLYFDQSLWGAALMRCRGAISATTSPGGMTVLNCDMSGFSGTIEVEQYRQANFGALSVKMAASGYALSSLSKFNPASILLKTKAKLIVSDDVLLTEGSNRGFMVGDESEVTVEVADGKLLEIGTCVTMADDGSMVKTGNGALQLGGRVCFGKNCADEPTEGKKYDLRIDSGVLRVFGAKACDGLSVFFAEGTSLELEYDPDDGELTGLGIRNVKNSVPFVLPEGVSALPLAVSLPAELERREHRIALSTVSTAAAADVRAMLSGVEVRRAGFSACSWEISNPDGSVTFGRTLKPLGTVVVIR